MQGDQIFGAASPATPASARPVSAARAWPPAAMTVFSFAGAALVSASSSAATPLYRLYQQSMHLTPLMITLVFAVYAICLLAALLTLGGLSDYVGRRPVILAGLLLNAAAMIVFAHANTVEELILARAVQGFCVGVAATAFGAAILDTSRVRGPLLNSLTAFVGLLVGSLGSAALVAYAPNPLHLVYEILLGITALLIVLLFWMPETVSRIPGALASLRPQISVPRQSRAILIRLTPVTIATWALGGFHMSLMPTVVAATMTGAPWISNLVLPIMLLVATCAVALSRNWPAARVILIGTSALWIGVALSLLGIAQHSVGILVAGSVIAGFGFGSSFSGTLRTLLPTAEPHQRAGLLSTFYVESYLAFGLPAVAAGLSVPYAGLAIVNYVYGVVVIVLSMISMVASMRSARPVQASG
jgi:predicted MFS family arabinose efflux permease